VLPGHPCSYASFIFMLWSGAPMPRAPLGQVHCDWLHMHIESRRNFEDDSEIGVVVFIQIPKEYLSFHMKEQPAFFIMFYAFCNCIH
jgi:hypothetical protein